jgi:hypothetical protein
MKGLIGIIGSLLPGIAHRKIIARISLHPFPVNISRIMKIPSHKKAEPQCIARIQVGGKNIFQGQVSKKPVRVYMVPAQGGGGIFPVYTGRSMGALPDFIIILPQ